MAQHLDDQQLQEEEEERRGRAGPESRDAPETPTGTSLPSSNRRGGNYQLRPSWKDVRLLGSDSSTASSQSWVSELGSLVAGWIAGSSNDEENDDPEATASPEGPFAPPSAAPSFWKLRGTTVAADSNGTGAAVDGPLGVPLEPATSLKDLGKVANVVGGSDADPSEAPYYVMFLSWSDARRQWEFTGCGGTLVSDRHVLTAAHCASGRDARRDAAYVGAHQPFWGNPGAPFHYSKVASYEIHPGFDDGPNRNDVALAVLQKPADPLEFRPVNLPGPGSLRLRDGDATKVYGFGRQSYGGTEQVKTLQVAELPFLTTSSCRKRYGSRKVYDDMVCSSGTGRDACRGDSGGPLVVAADPPGGDAYQVGVVSWGVGCGSRPGVYASTQYHHEWIRDQVCGSSAPAVQSPLCQRSASSPSWPGGEAAGGGEEQRAESAPGASSPRPRSKPHRRAAGGPRAGPASAAAREGPGAGRRRRRRGGGRFGRRAEGGARDPAAGGAGSPSAPAARRRPGEQSSPRSGVDQTVGPSGRNLRGGDAGDLSRE